MNKNSIGAVVAIALGVALAACSDEDSNSLGSLSSAGVSGSAGAEQGASGGLNDPTAEGGSPETPSGGRDAISGGAGASECPLPLSCNWCDGDYVRDADDCITGYRCANGTDPCSTAACLGDADCGTDETCGSDGLCWPATTGAGGALGSGGMESSGGATTASGGSSAGLGGAPSDGGSGGAGATGGDSGGSEGLGGSSSPGGSAGSAPEGGGGGLAGGGGIGDGGSAAGGAAGQSGGGGTVECSPPLSCNWCDGDYVRDADGCIVGYLCANGADPCSVSACLADDDCGVGESCGDDMLCWPAE